MIEVPRENGQGRGEDRAGEPITLSARYLAALTMVESLATNRDGADKAWVGRAMDDVRLYFARVRKA